MAELSAPCLNDPEGTRLPGVLVLDLVAVVLVVGELLPVPT